MSPKFPPTTELILQGGVDVRDGVRRRSRIGVNKPEDVSARGQCSGVLLRAPAASAFEHDRSRRCGKRDCFIFAAAVHNQDFLLPFHGLQGT